MASIFDVGNRYLGNCTIDRKILHTFWNSSDTSEIGCADDQSIIKISQTPLKTSQALTIPIHRHISRMIQFLK
jgi:hypothetical protein